MSTKSLLPHIIVFIFSGFIFLSHPFLPQSGSEASAQAALDAAIPSLDLASSEAVSPAVRVHAFIGSRLEADLSAMGSFRPGYPFWQHIFTIPDGSIAFGSAQDGRLLAVFPSQGDWTRNARWEEHALAARVNGRQLPRSLSQRREEVASLLEPTVGMVLHNPTRGRFLLPNARRYGGFLEEWGSIYERFGVPAEIGLAQAILESGLNGRIRSSANAIGFCQWLIGNWNHMKRYAPNVIEGYNQTTQAPYCAAYLTVLATKYGSFIPALSEHHAGGTNVGRTLINGERLGGQDVRERYFLGSEFAVDLRAMSMDQYREVVRTYGPRSFRYAEMVFGNTRNVVNLRESIPQERVYAMRATRPIAIDEVSRRTGLSVDEVRRYNPALVRQVPRGANLYLPLYIADFGPNVSFWHQPPDEQFKTVLDDFVRLDATLLEWENPTFAAVLREYQRRFAATDTEEGAVMGAVLNYVIDESYQGGRSELLAEYRTSTRIQRLVEQGVRERTGAGGR